MNINKTAKECMNDAYTLGLHMRQLFEAPRVELYRGGNGGTVLCNFLGEGSEVEVTREEYNKLMKFIKSINEKNKISADLEVKHD
jgi:hypothetical protein